MSIVFFCQSCGSKFDVDRRMAGKQGRCKKCGTQMTVPKVDEVAPRAAKPEPAAVGTGAGAGTAPAAGWLGAMAPSQVGLAPLTVDRMPGLKKHAIFEEDDLADSKPYVLAQPERGSGGRPVSQVSAVMIFWRQRLGAIERVFRWINQTAYLLSVPFLMILLLGILVRNHPMAIMGATVVVVLNIARLVSGFANLVVIPFRDGINLKRMKKPLRRFIEPALTIGLVGLAFAFSPWLARGGTSKGILPGHVRAGLEGFEKKIEDVQGKAKALEGETNDRKR